MFLAGGRALPALLALVVTSCRAEGAEEKAPASAIPAQAASTAAWLTLHTDDSVSPANGTVIIRDKHTNARNMWVFASRFHYTAALQAVKVKLTPSGSPAATLAAPLVTSVRSTAGGHTFNIPDAVLAKNGSILAVQSTATRVVCPQAIGEEEYLTVTVGTGLDPRNTNSTYTFEIEFQPVGHWSLLLDAPLKLEAQPSEPAVFSFTWPPNPPETAVVSVASINSPEVCSSMALQHRTCPLALTEPEFTIDSNYVTMTSSAAMTVKRSQYPDGLFVIVLPRVSDQLCNHNAPAVAEPGRKKTVEVTVTAQSTRRGYFAVAPVVALVLLIVGGISACALHRRVDHPPVLAILREERAHDQERRGSADTDELVLDSGLGLRTDRELENGAGPPSQLSPVSLLIAAALVLLSLGGEAVFSGLRAQKHTGNLDFCYGNDLCDHAIGRLTGANHILSRLPYVGAALGLLLAIQALKRSFLSITADGTVSVGVEHDFGLLDSLWLSLLVQAALSAIYSACPSPRVAEMDVAFATFTLTTLAVKLYQGRRGIVSAGHYAPLLLTCLVVTAGLVVRAAGGAWYVWLVLAVLHVLTAVAVAGQLYVLGAVSLTPAAMRRVWAESHRAVESPNHVMNRATAIITILANIAIAVSGLAARITDFTQYLMVFLTVHTVIYLAYYLLIKTVKADENVQWSSRILLALGVMLFTACVIIRCGFTTFDVSLSPSASRLLRRRCLGSSTMDVHDLWHVMQATALFCLSLGVLLVDGDQMMTPRIGITKF